MEPYTRNGGIIGKTMDLAAGDDGIWDLQAVLEYKSQPVIEPGQVAFTTAGTTSWTVPAGVTSICAVLVGGGGGGAGHSTTNVAGSGGGAGGGLRWINNLAVTPGETLTIVVGAGGTAGTTTSNNGGSGGQSRIARGGNILVFANGGAGGTYTGATTTAAAGGTGSTISGNIGGGNGGAGGVGVSGNDGGGGGVAWAPAAVGGWVERRGVVGA